MRRSFAATTLSGIGVLAVAWCWAVVAAAAGDQGQQGQTLNPLGCRLMNYGKYQEAAWKHLPAIGIKYVFTSVPAPDQVEATLKQLAASRLKVAVLRGQSDLSNESAVAELGQQCAVCQKMGAKYMFLSPKHPGVSKEVACQRLRKVGDLAQKHGVTVVLETHPDLGLNGDQHVATMKAINHPNVRVNFDTGNITYYNKDSDAVTELKKCIDYVATVEIKDHNGQFETWNFPPLGQGKVDIPGVLKVLKEHNFRGPITVEVEGVQYVDRSECKILRDIAESMAYLRSLGQFE